MVEVENVLVSADPPHRGSENQITGKIKPNKTFCDNVKRHKWEVTSTSQGRGRTRMFCRVVKGTSAVNIGFWTFNALHRNGETT